MINIPFKLNNIQRIRLIYMFGYNCFFILPVLVLYYNYKGLSTGDFFLLQSIFSIIVFIIEIPTGYIADIYSRKRVIIISVFLWLIGLALLLSADSFISFALAETVMAFSRAFLSGTLQAYLYDALALQNEKDKALNEQGKLEAYALASTAISSLVGGFLFHTYKPLPIIISIIFCIIGTIISLTLPNIKEEKKKIHGIKNKLKDISEITKFATKYNQELKLLMFYPAIIFSATSILFWFIQTYLETLGVSYNYFGVIMFITLSMKSLFAYNADKINIKFGLARIIVTMFICVQSTLILLYLSTIYEFYLFGNIIVIIGIMLSVSMINGIGISTFTVLINHRIETKDRATIISIFQMVRRVILSPIMFMMKPIIDNYGMSSATIFVLITTSLSIVPLIKLYKLNIIR